jgi:hypothetical protein
MSGMDCGVEHKVATILAEIAGDRAARLSGLNPASTFLVNALVPETTVEKAADIAFHLTDWAADAAFLVAVQLYPERFTDEEIREGVLAFIIHAPNHVAAAAHLSGWPVRDVFKVGLKLVD